MNRIARLGFALILAATALVPGRSAAYTCDINRCFNNSCSQHVCPSGQIAVPRCLAATCTPYCSCFTPPS
jgi:hypothetical protein